MNVVFDLGAVLIAWEPARLMQAHFPERAPSPESAGALARAFFHHQDWFDFDCGIRSVDEVVAKTAARLSLPLDRVHALVAPLGERLEPIAENIALLAALHARRAAQGGLQLFYLSNMPVPYARALERRFSFFEGFDGGIFSGDVKRIKPNSEIYEMLAWRHGLAPEKTLFIDDAASNVEAARALGWHAIHCTAPLALSAQVERFLGSHWEAAATQGDVSR
ncbi:MAG: HAD family phosphatase [Variovorax sp.]|uniref:HAD family phosphatase n=1 Tax=Variovorax guangxiensis TaxID=1775474 RepID=A0A502DVZ9_9BURK|nr:HAD-IA family hydrolase [Variovorax guangxiensis]RZI65181.1 MAG: HAD family phosphatase [Variovorax sp.]TPG24292.1 HAD family phosphatase [Variovorax ginsengisoli]TPG28542.1 HAD family phosphatase [Variovorax guangxiensis]